MKFGDIEIITDYRAPKGYAIRVDPEQLRGKCFLCGEEWTGLNEHACPMQDDPALD